VDVTKHTSEAERKSANARTALTFASIAVVFFLGIIVAHALGGPVVGVAVVGGAVLLFLVFVIGRHLRGPR
jgi:small neutral amino acid transporter SnatA (MarC family)